MHLHYYIIVEKQYIFLEEFNFLQNNSIAEKVRPFKVPRSYFRFIR